MKFTSNSYGKNIFGAGCGIGIGGLLTHEGIFLAVSIALLVIGVLLLIDWEWLLAVRADATSHLKSGVIIDIIRHEQPVLIPPQARPVTTPVTPAVSNYWTVVFMDANGNTGLHSFSFDPSANYPRGSTFTRP